MREGRDQEDHATLVRVVVTALAGGATPEDLARTRRRLGQSATPLAVARALCRQPTLDLGPTVPHRDADDIWSSPSEETVLVTGASMPVALSRSWSDGGPLWLRRQGVAVPTGPAVAVVGTRRPTLDGLDLAAGIAAGLAARGVVVVSGMARGIDQAAHRGALQADGWTTAVIGTGHGVDYPSGTTALRRQVASSGSVLSEYAPGRGVRHPTQFLARNRIIAGLVAAVVVVEAGVRSGALNTAGWALQMGREVLVVPHSPSNTAAAGGLALLDVGATPVRDAQDVMDVLDLDDLAASPALARKSSAHGAEGLDPVSADVLALLGPAPVTVSALSQTLAASARDVLVALSVLEAQGLAGRRGDGVVSATPDRRR